jgi:uncharacterized protein
MAEETRPEAEFIGSAKLGRVYLIRIPAGQDISKRLIGALGHKDVRRAVILSAIGAVCDVTFRNLREGIDLPVSREKFADVVRPGPYEMVSLEGNLMPIASRPALHLHAALGSEDGTLIGGHVFSATAFTSVEIIVAELTDSMVVRKRDEGTGFAEWGIAKD